MTDTSAPALIFRPRSFFEPLTIGEIFAAPQPLEVEIGAGDGSFLVNYTALHPERNFLGVERLLGRLKKVERKAQRMGLKNLRGLRIEGAYFTEYLLPAGAADVIHIYFADPWPKKKHRRHRLVNERFTELVHRALKDRGIIYLRTDDLDYYEQMVTVFDANQKFEKVETPEELSAVKTDFEREFNAKGIPTNYAAYRKR